MAQSTLDELENLLDDLENYRPPSVVVNSTPSNPRDSVQTDNSFSFSFLNKVPMPNEGIETKTGTEEIDAIIEEVTSSKKASSTPPQPAVSLTAAPKQIKSATAVPQSKIEYQPANRNSKTSSAPPKQPEQSIPKQETPKVEPTPKQPEQNTPKSPKIETPKVEPTPKVETQKKTEPSPKLETSTKKVEPQKKVEEKPPSPVMEKKTYQQPKVETKPNPTPSSSLPSTEASDAEKEREILIQQLAKLEETKKAQAKAEDYDGAHKTKAKIQDIEAQIQKLDQKISAIKLTESANRASLRNKEEKKEPPKFDNVYLAKLDELTKLKQQAIHDEDYDKAEYYKQQIAQLQGNYTKDTQPQQQSLGTSRNFSKDLKAVSTAEIQKNATIRKQLKEDSRLYDLARGGRIAEVKKFVEEEEKKGVDIKELINSIDFTTGNTALHGAASAGFRDVAKYIVEKGADVNVKNRRGQTPLHLTVEKRVDDLTYWIIEHGGDIYIQDNQGKSPFDIAGVAPIYQGELKEFMWKRAPRPKDLDNPTEVKQEEPTQLTTLQIYVKNGSYFTVQATDVDTPQQVLRMTAEKMRVESILDDLELVEEVMGKERKLAPTEKVIAALAKWPNSNAQFCKFKMNIKRGSPEKAQMIFREAMYGNK